MDPFRHGFRIAGDVSAERKLIFWWDAFGAYCAADERADLRSTCFLSVFTFGDDFAARVRRDYSVDVKGFDGACFAPFVWFDIDRPDLDAALADGRKLAGAILHTYTALDEDELLYFFSGSKGLHLGIPTALIGAEPSQHFHQTARRFAMALAERAEITIDDAIYRKVQPFRAPNSRHPRTGLHKARLTYGGLMKLNAEGVRRLAAAPRGFELPDPPALCDRSAADWRAAAEQTEAPHTTHPERTTLRGRLTRLTLDFINGNTRPSEGSRNNTLYRAAANLAECGVPPDVIALLVENPARDCGLRPADIAATVASAARKRAS